MKEIKLKTSFRPFGWRQSILVIHWASSCASFCLRSPPLPSTFSLSNPLVFKSVASQSWNRLKCLSTGFKVKSSEVQALFYRI